MQDAFVIETWSESPLAAAAARSFLSSWKDDRYSSLRFASGSFPIPGWTSCLFIASIRDRLPILSRQIARAPASKV